MPNPASDDRPISVLIADDEPLALAFLRRLIAQERDFDIVSEARDGREALAALRLRAPEVAFMDIRMPYVSGMEAAREAAGGATIVVFVTAHDQHAVQAFEAGGVDYLLKPLTAARFRKAIEKVRSDVRRRRLEADFLLTGRDAGDVATLRVRVGKDIRFVRLDDLEWIEAANQYVNLRLRTGASILACYSLSECHRRLSRDFFRVHRSAVVNRAHIVAIRTDGDKGVRLVMKSGATIHVSRRFRKALSRLAPPTGSTDR